MRRELIFSAFFLIFIFVLTLFFEAWFFFAVFSAFLFGALFLIDAFLFKDRKYYSFLEPTAISGMLQLLPWGVVFWVGVPNLANETSLIAIVSGMFSMIAMALYFKAMNMRQDGVLIALLWNLIIVTVPFVAHFFFVEALSLSQYFGIALVLGGVVAVVYKKTVVNWNVVGVMLLSVVSMTVSIIAIKEVYGRIDDSSAFLAFFKGFLPFVLGEGIVGICAFFLMNFEEKRHIKSLVKHLWYLFFLIEGGQVLAQSLASYALKIGNISLVVSVSGLIGIFVISLASIVLFVLEKTMYRELVTELHREQFQNIRMKIIGISVSALGAYFIGV